MGKTISGYLDSHKDKNGNVPVILNTGSTDRRKRYLLLQLSAEFVKWLYVTPGTGVYYTNAVRPIGREMVFGVTEIYANDFPNQFMTN